MENNAFSMVAMKTHCKTQQFHCFWLPDSSPDHEKHKKTMVCHWLLSKTIVKHNVFATFGLQNRLQNLSKSFPKLSKLGIPKS